MIKITNKKQQNNKTKNQKNETKKHKIKKLRGTNRSDVRKEATKILKNQEKEKTKIQLTVDGDVSYVAGAYIILDETWGAKFSGKYIIDKIDHSIGSDYSCQIDAYKIEELAKEE